MPGLSPTYASPASNRAITNVLASTHDDDDDDNDDDNENAPQDTNMMVKMPQAAIVRFGCSRVASGHTVADNFKGLVALLASVS